MSDNSADILKESMLVVSAVTEWTGAMVMPYSLMFFRYPVKISA